MRKRPVHMRGGKKARRRMRERRWMRQDKQEGRRREPKRMSYASAWHCRHVFALRQAAPVTDLAVLASNTKWTHEIGVVNKGVNCLLFSWGSIIVIQVHRLALSALDSALLSVSYWCLFLRSLLRMRVVGRLCRGGCGRMLKRRSRWRYTHTLEGGGIPTQMVWMRGRGRD
ncbi:hypothetical protein C8R48DRAFT_701770 [Suillus tomentosus]|nr:hypothetical protein C8R48DRAFT_701770 [Suillus tomentosus]